MNAASWAADFIDLLLPAGLYILWNVGAGRRGDTARVRPMSDPTQGGAVAPLRAVPLSQRHGTHERSTVPRLPGLVGSALHGALRLRARAACR